MKTDRADLLKVLTIAMVGLTKREVLEQSNAFIFTDKHLITFNGEVFTKAKNPIPSILGAVPAIDLLKILMKFPDDEVEIITKGEELRVKGRRKSAGITMHSEIALPYTDVPNAGKWKALPETMMGTALQAARICGRDEAQPRTTEVHITRRAIEACDNYRMFRAVIDTGIAEELLVPAASLMMVGNLVFTKICYGDGWLHLRTKSKHRVSLRCSAGDYPELNDLLKMRKPKNVKLPGNLPDILNRVEIMQDFNGMASVGLKEGLLTIKTRKESGWYRESKKVDYGDVPLSFEVNTQFLQEMMARTRNVQISDNKMRIKSGDTVFVVCLEMPG